MGGGLGMDWEVVLEPLNGNTGQVKEGQGAVGRCGRK